MVLVTVPRTLREVLGEEGADALVALVNQAGSGYKSETMELVEQRYERRLTDEAGKLEQRIVEVAVRLDRRITEEVAKLDRRITEEVAKLDARIAKLDHRITEEAAGLRVELAGVKADLLRWMFIFWVGQIGVLMGILFAFFPR